MAGKLKTFTTTSGFFDLAVAAPSMKAALDLWAPSSISSRTALRDRPTSDRAAAQAALEEAQAAHARTLREIGKAQARLDRKTSGEEARWKREKERLDDALRRARVPRPLKVV